MIVVVMGVSGSGKLTIGFGLAAELGWSYVDGDDLHSPANVARMHEGIPLTDADRAPWLDAIAERLASWDRAHRDGVLACSALRRAYRDRLREAAPLTFVFLDVAEPLLRTRMAGRRGHFMPVGMLDSQLATLERPEPDEHAVVIPIEHEQRPGAIVAAVVAGLRTLPAAEPPR